MATIILPLIGAWMLAAGGFSVGLCLARGFLLGAALGGAVCVAGAFLVGCGADKTSA